MKTDLTQREQQRVSELATEYRKKGYKVLLPRTTADVPSFLREWGYIPDLIVTSETEKLIIEVKSASTMSTVGRLSEISEAVNARRDWEFMLVVTNPKQRSAVLSPKANDNVNVNALVSRARHVLELRDPLLRDAAFLYAWIAVEAAFRSAADKQAGPEKARPPLTVIRNAVIAGQLDREVGIRLERLFKLRSDVLHAGVSLTAMHEDIEWLLEVALSIAGEHPSEQL